MQDEVWTVGRLLSWTADYLKKHGSDSPRLDAEVLLAHSLGCERIELYTCFDEQPGDERRSAFRDLVRRRAEGMPVAYLVGHREFFSLSFRVTEDVLIPRPETEHLVVAAIDLTRQVKGHRTVCDVGTGSGIIAVCLARRSPSAGDGRRYQPRRHRNRPAERRGTRGRPASRIPGRQSAGGPAGGARL